MRKFMVGVIMIVSTAAVTHATPITAVTNEVPGNGSLNAGSQDFGWQFSLSQTITVLDLGIFDSTQLDTANDVVIYQCPDSSCTSGAAVVSGTVAGNAAFTGNFRYSPLASSVVLNAGNYVVTARILGDEVIYDSTAPTFGTGITFVQERSLPQDSAAFPTNFGMLIGFFGPNFHYDLGADAGPPSVPEPATGWLFASALVVFGSRFAWRRRPIR